MTCDFKIRLAGDEHLDFMTRIDLEDEGISNAVPGRFRLPNCARRSDVGRDCQSEFSQGLAKEARINGLGL
jgi:hypothetical protein